jgi:Meckel syndrome type 1 protein
MTRHAFAPSLLLAPLALAAGGCASDAGDFPSLAQRPAERAFAAEQMAPPQVRPPLPADAAVAARAEDFVARAREAAGGFARAYEAAAAAAARAGPRGSDSWTVAQEAVSRTVAAQAPLTRIAGEFDDYAAVRARQTPLAPADVARLHDATAEVERMVAAQTGRIRRLEAALSR